jgi:hypothetical protein
MEATTTEKTGASTNGNGHVTADDQQGLFDQVIKNDELETALEEREKKNNSRKAVTAAFKEADAKAKGIIATLDIEPDTTIRVGRFRITKSSVEGRSVAFETEPTERLSISTVD